MKRINILLMFLALLFCIGFVRADCAFDETYDYPADGMVNTTTRTIVHLFTPWWNSDECPIMNCTLDINDSAYRIVNQSELINNTQSTITYAYLADGDYKTFISCENGSTGHSSEIHYLTFNTELPLEISDCGTLDIENRTYVLTADILDKVAEVACIDITANNTTLDCQGHVIDGVDNTTETIGIQVNRGGHELDTETYNTTIKNCVLSDWSWGIIVQNSSGNSIYNNTISSNTGGGVSLDYTSDTAVHGNNFTDEINDAIDIDFGAGGNSVYNNTAINASELLGLIETSGNEVYDNYAYGFTCDGIWLSDASENVIHNNILQDNGLSGCCAIDLGTENGECANNYIYSNMLNSTINVCFFGDVYGNYWNTTRGNYYTNPTGSGYSDNCIDVDVNGFCDLPYDVYNNESCMLLDGCSNNTDYLPLWGGHVVPTVPTTPAISITSYDYHWVNLTIGTCTDIGGSGISKRVLYRDTTNIANFTGSTATRYNSTGLANSTTYTWRLSCLDNYGLYSANSSVSLTMPSTGYIQKYSSTEVGYTIQDTLGAFFSAIATYSGTIMLIVVSILCLGGVVLIYLKIRSTAK